VNLARELLAGGHSVRVLSHQSNLGLEGLPVEYANGDVCRLSSLREAFRGCEAVYHLAAHISLRMNDRGLCASVNVEGTKNVIAACRQEGVRRLVHFSTIHALQNEPSDCAVDEARPLVSSFKAPPYDRSKAAGELLIREAVQAGLDAVIINPTGVIGPYDYRPSHFGQALILIASGRMPVIINGGFDWVDARDVARWAVVAEKQAPRGARYLFSGNWLSMADISTIAAEIMGGRPPAFTCPMPLAKFCAPIVTAFSDITGSRPIFTDVSLAALNSHRCISHDKATRELGYSPRPVRDTLADSIRWFIDNGYLREKGGKPA
jgi:dihydroflavonol-4-reductase